MQSTRYSCRILTQHEFFRRIFEKKEIQKSIFTKLRPVGTEMLHAAR